MWESKVRYGMRWECRRQTKSTTDTMAIVSKKIQMCIRLQQRNKHKAHIGHILDEFKGLRHISGIKNARRKEHITSLQSSDGSQVFDQRAIADVFADFYEKLYAATHANASDQRPIAKPGIPPFSDAELITGLRQLKHGKSADTSGLAAEVLKYGGKACDAHFWNYTTLS